jgi:hypothetical protein
VLGNGLQLDIAGSLVDLTDLAIAKILLDRELACEAHASQPLDTVRCRSLGHLRSVQLAHGCLLDEWQAGVLELGGVVHHQTRSLDFRGDLCILVLHSLKVDQACVELLAVTEIWHCMVEHSLNQPVITPQYQAASGKQYATKRDKYLCQSKHLRSNANATFVQNCDGILVALAKLSKDIGLGNDDIIELYSASGRSANAQLLEQYHWSYVGQSTTLTRTYRERERVGEREGVRNRGTDKDKVESMMAATNLVFLGCNRNTWERSLYHEARDALVAFGRISVGHNQEDIGLTGVGDPHLVTIQDPIISMLLGSGLHGERIATGRLLGQAEATDLCVRACVRERESC